MKISRRLAPGGVVLILAFTLGSLSLWGYYHYSPSAMLLKKLKQRATQGQRQLHNLSDVEIPEKKGYLVKLRRVHQSFQKLDELSGQLRQMFPEEEKLGRLLDWLSRAAESEGVKVLRIKPSEPIEKESWWEISVELEFICGLTELQTYLTSIERLPRFIRIDSFSIALQEDGLPQLKAKMICTAFVFKRGVLKDET